MYFKNFETVSPAVASRLSDAIEETGLSRRVRLLFSCSVQENEAMPEVMRMICERLGYLTLPLPSLRSRSDEIPSLASLYLNSLNLELGKQFSGFEPRALELLRQYPWPNNYTQFKNLLRSLAILSDGPYIGADTVAELLAKERVLRSAQPVGLSQIRTDQTLEDIISEAVRQTVAAHGGNRAAAARQLGISRTTLWRYLGRLGEERAED